MIAEKSLLCNFLSCRYIELSNNNVDELRSLKGKMTKLLLAAEKSLQIRRKALALAFESFDKLSFSQKYIRKNSVSKGEVTTILKCFRNLALYRFNCIIVGK